MALRVTIPATQYGIPLPDAYVKIANFRGDKEKSFMVVHSFANQGARDAGLAPLNVKEYMLDTSELAGTLLPSLYNWLKLQPEFADAQDC